MTTTGFYHTVGGGRSRATLKRIISSHTAHRLRCLTEVAEDDGQQLLAWLAVAAGKAALLANLHELKGLTSCARSGT